MLRFILLSLFTLSAHAESASYSSDLNLLFIPNVKIEGQHYINGVLHLDNNGNYALNTLTKLEADQEALLQKVNSIPCGQADTLGKLSAYLNFLDGNKSYCLVKTITTVEGGKILRYLFIEKGSAQIIIDTRKDAFAGCCHYLQNIQYTNIQFGYAKEGLFVEQSNLVDIDLKLDYAIRLIVSNGSADGSF